MCLLQGSIVLPKNSRARSHTQPCVPKPTPRSIKCWSSNQHAKERVKTNSTFKPSLCPILQSSPRCGECILVINLPNTEVQQDGEAQGIEFPAWTLKSYDFLSLSELCNLNTEMCKNTYIKKEHMRYSSQEARRLSPFKQASKYIQENSCTVTVYCNYLMVFFAIKHPVQIKWKIFGHVIVLRDRLILELTLPQRGRNLAIKAQRPTPNQGWEKYKVGAAKTIDRSPKTVFYFQKFSFGLF